MRSATLPSFWVEYRRLSDEIKQSARKAYELWQENPFHPSLHFKCVNSEYVKVTGAEKKVIVDGFNLLGLGKCTSLITSIEFTHWGETVLIIADVPLRKSN